MRPVLYADINGSSSHLLYDLCLIQTEQMIKHSILLKQKAKIKYNQPIKWKKNILTWY